MAGTKGVKTMIEGFSEIMTPKKDKKLPVVLSKEKVKRILNVASNIKHKAILMLIYSGGLWVGKVIRLRLEDIDSNRKLIYIRASKGRKDHKKIFLQ